MLDLPPVIHTSLARIPQIPPPLLVWAGGSANSTLVAISYTLRLYRSSDYASYVLEGPIWRQPAISFFKPSSIFPNAETLWATQRVEDSHGINVLVAINRGDCRICCFDEL